MENIDSTEEIMKAIHNKELPRFIYKYFTSENSRLQDALKEQYIWFSHRKDFNDPYDCNLLVNTENTQKEIIDYVDYLCKKRDVNGPEKLKVLSNYLNPQYLSKFTNKSIQDAIDKSGVSCFSNRNDSILMWSHYTNSHKGFCVKFDIVQDPEFFLVPIVMDYQTKYPYFNYIRDFKNIFNFSFGHKFEDWQYEEEIRIVKQDQGKVLINKRAIVEIMFGISCDKEDIKTIKDICTTHNYDHIVFSKAEKLENEFKIDFKKL